MDARTKKQQAVDQDDGRVVVESDSAKRDRLLASLNLLGGIGLIIAMPFALRAGAEFFMPVTAALVVAIALVPMLEWFERRGVPSRLSAGLCVIIFLALAIFSGRVQRWLERVERLRRPFEIVSGAALVGVAGYFVRIAAIGV